MGKRDYGAIHQGELFSAAEAVFENLDKKEKKTKEKKNGVSENVQGSEEGSGESADVGATASAD
jgi:hypothetical protein